jgi:cell division cycle 2-like protein
VRSLRGGERQYSPQQLRRALRLGAAAYGGAAQCTDAGLELLAAMLELDPAKRISASDALAHKWFSEAPPPCDPRLLPSFPSEHDI